MKTTINTLRWVNGDLGLRTSGMYCNPYKRGKEYVDQTFRTIEIRCQIHIRHGQPEKSAVAEHMLNTGHEIQFEKNT